MCRHCLSVCAGRHDCRLFRPYGGRQLAVPGLDFPDDGIDAALHPGNPDRQHRAGCSPVGSGIASGMGAVSETQTAQDSQKDIGSHWDKTDVSTQNKLETLIDTLRLEKFNIIDLNLDQIISKADQLHIDVSGYEFKRSISYERFNHFHELSEILRNGRLNDGYQVTNDLYKIAIKEVQVLKSDIDSVFDDIDLIITPSAPGEALKGLEYTGPATFNTTWSLSGNPCITVPLFKGEQNLPIGCQLVTRFGYDNQLLDYAKSLLDVYLK